MTDSITKKGEWRFSIENSFVRNADLHPAARLLYIILRGYVGPNCQMPFPSLPTLAKHLGCSRETVQKYLKELEQLGYITKNREESRAQGKFAATRYILHESPKIRHVPTVAKTHRSGKTPLRLNAATKIVPCIEESKESKESAGAVFSETKSAIPHWKEVRQFIAEQGITHVSLDRAMDAIERLHKEGCLSNWRGLLIGLDKKIKKAPKKNDAKYYTMDNGVMRPVR